MVSPAPSTKPVKRYTLAQIPHGEAALRALARYGYLLNPQLAKLLFVGTNGRSFMRAWDVCNRQCLAPLLKEGWIERVPVQHTHAETGHTFQDRANLLTAAGRHQLDTIAKKFGLPDKVRRRTGLKQQIYNASLSHKLAIRDAAIALETACNKHGWTFSHWLDDADFRAAHARHSIRMPNQPDGFGVVTAGNRRCPLFFEVDRATEPAESFVSPERAYHARIGSYGSYLRDAYLTDPFWPRLGLSPVELERPIVLTFTDDVAHAMKIIAATRAAGGRGSYWTMAWSEVDPDTDLGAAAVWRVTISQRPRRLAEHILGKPEKEE